MSARIVLAILQFDEEVRSPPTEELERIVYAPNEPVLVMAPDYPGWEAETAMQFGSTPNRMKVQQIGAIRPDQGWSLALSDFVRIMEAVRPEAYGLDQRLLKLEHQVTRLEESLGWIRRRPEVATP